MVHGRWEPWMAGALSVNMGFRKKTCWIKSRHSDRLWCVSLRLILHHADTTSRRHVPPTEGSLYVAKFPFFCIWGVGSNHVSLCFNIYICSNGLILRSQEVHAQQEDPSASSFWQWGVPGKYKFLIGGFEHDFYFSIYREYPFQLTFIFFRGVGQPPIRFSIGKMMIPHWICGDPMFSGARIQIIAKTRDHHVHSLSCAWTDPKLVGTTAALPTIHIPSRTQSLFPTAHFWCCSKVPTFNIIHVPFGKGLRRFRLAQLSHHWIIFCWLLYMIEILHLSTPCRFFHYQSSYI